jgi:hypothetical protein
VWILRQPEQLPARCDIHHKYQTANFMLSFGEYRAASIAPDIASRAMLKKENRKARLAGLRISLCDFLSSFPQCCQGF